MGVVSTFMVVWARHHALGGREVRGAVENGWQTKPPKIPHTRDHQTASNRYMY